MRIAAVRALPRWRAVRSPLPYRLFSSSSSVAPLRFLVIDGYIQWGREDLQSGGATTAGELYEAMMAKCAPPGVPVETVLIHPSDDVFEPPEDLSQFHAVGWSGSSLTVHKTEDERIQRMLALARQFYALGIPQLGSCFGLQIAVAAAGGTIRKNPNGKEVGLARKIALTPEGRAHPMYDGKPAVFGGFSSHNDQVTHIAPGGIKLASNAFTHIQAASVRYLNGDFWGLQYHPEYDLHEFARLLYCRRKVSIELGFFKDMESADALIEDLETLHRDRSRKDIAWRLGFDDDVLDDDIRTIEVRNFIKHLVMPYYYTQQQQ
jgi:GMP synthase (glutamine-hydrolysing)